MTVESPMPLYTGFIQLGAGLSVGLAGLAAGFAIGIVGDAGVRGTAQQPRLFVGMVSCAAALSVGVGKETAFCDDRECTLAEVRELDGDGDVRQQRPVIIAPR